MRVNVKNSIVMPNIRYGLSVYGATDAELITVQCFLDRCKKRRYTSQVINIREIMKDHDRKIYLKVKDMETHPLFRMLPKKKEIKYISLEMKHLYIVYIRYMLLIDVNIYKNS